MVFPFKKGLGLSAEAKSAKIVKIIMPKDEILHIYFFHGTPDLESGSYPIFKEQAPK